MSRPASPAASNTSSPDQCWTTPSAYFSVKRAACQHGTAVILSRLRHSHCRHRTMHVEVSNSPKTSHNRSDMFHSELHLAPQLTFTFHCRLCLTLSTAANIDHSAVGPADDCDHVDANKITAIFVSILNRLFPRRRRECTCVYFPCFAIATQASGHIIQHNVGRNKNHSSRCILPVCFLTSLTFPSIYSFTSLLLLPHVCNRTRLPDPYLQAAIFQPNGSS